MFTFMLHSNSCKCVKLDNCYYHHERELCLTCIDYWLGYIYSIKFSISEFESYFHVCVICKQDMNGHISFKLFAMSFVDEDL